MTPEAVPPVPPAPDGPVPADGPLADLRRKLQAVAEQWKEAAAESGSDYDKSGARAYADAVGFVDEALRAAVEASPTPPAPETERVPWHQAIGRRLESGALITAVKDTMAWGPVVACGTDWRNEWLTVDDDGMVLVLREAPGPVPSAPSPDPDEVAVHRGALVALIEHADADEAADVGLCAAIDQARHAAARRSPGGPEA